MSDTVKDGFFEQCADPIAIVDIGGAVRWTNIAAKSRWGKPVDTLYALYDEAIVAEILATESYNEIPISSSNGVPITLVVLDISHDDPDNQMLLLSWKPYPSQKAFLSEREEALAAISHDLRNPLGAIFGYVDVMLDTRVGEGLLDVHREILTRVRKTIIRCIDLVKNYQILGQLRVGTSGPPPAINLNEAVGAIFEELRRDDETMPTVRLALNKEMVPVLIERFPLERVIANLLSNALKFSPSNGTVEVKTDRKGSMGILSIKNSGPAIPRQELPTIFKRYKRGSTAANKPGTGLGLYIVKEIIDAALGSIEIESSEEHGTVVTVTLRGPE